MKTEPTFQQILDSRAKAIGEELTNKFIDLGMQPTMHFEVHDMETDHKFLVRAYKGGVGTIQHWEDFNLTAIPLPL